MISQLFPPTKGIREECQSSSHLVYLIRSWRVLANTKTDPRSLFRCVLSSGFCCALVHLSVCVCVLTHTSHGRALLLPWTTLTMTTMDRLLWEKWFGVLSCSSFSLKLTRSHNSSAFQCCCMWRVKLSYLFHIAHMLCRSIVERWERWLIAEEHKRMRVRKMQQELIRCRCLSCFRRVEGREECSFFFCGAVWALGRVKKNCWAK